MAAIKAKFGNKVNTGSDVDAAFKAASDGPGITPTELKQIGALKKTKSGQENFDAAVSKLKVRMQKGKVTYEVAAAEIKERAPTPAPASSYYSSSAPI
jgi:hypothetical protein